MVEGFLMRLDFCRSFTFDTENYKNSFFFSFSVSLFFRFFFFFFFFFLHELNVDFQTYFFSFYLLLVVPVDITFRLRNMKWNGNLSDAASKSFKTLTNTIQQNVRFIICQLRHLIYTKLVLLSFSQRVGPFIPTPGKQVKYI